MFTATWLGATSASSEVKIYDIKKDNWKEGPSLQVARQSANTTFIKNCLYIFGGENENEGSLNSLEVLDIDAATKKWDLILLDRINIRNLSIVCAINYKEILIMGGKYQNYDGKDIFTEDSFIYNVNRKEARPIELGRFRYFSQGQNVISIN